MRKIMLSLVGILMVAVASCSNPSSSVVIDKSPYEYVLPENVDLNDYTYVGDYVFADSMNFAEWKFANGSAFSEFGYFMVFEKISRVKWNNVGLPMCRWEQDGVTPYLKTEKGTKYKVYLKTSFIEDRKNNPNYCNNPQVNFTNRSDVVFANSWGAFITAENVYDGSVISIESLNAEFTSFEVSADFNMENYVTY